ncbi:MAG: glutamate--tRNA ligase [Aquificota bacterium]|nr:MAG: glutamate--tRNA ligase [Aquificota bacterium]
MVKVRFAPSPTGYLHLGGARTAIFNWLFARHNGGRFILRIEDTDKSRSTEESIREILEAMEWLGLDWDEGPYRQTERLDIYRREAQRLLDEGKAYYCYCTTEELEERRKKALEEGRMPKYDGRCRERTEPREGVDPVIRLKVSQEGETEIHDLIKGEVVYPNSQLDDFILVRSDGTPTYNFVVVVDDALMGITHVIRGDDHLNNTPKQIQLYRALGYEPPQFAHVPMILGPDRTRLSKRHGATSVLAYREEGYLPEALFNFLVRLGWSHGDQEIFSKEELIQHFSLENVGRSPAVYNPDKLLWLNAHYIKTGDNGRLAKLLIPFLMREGLVKEAQQPDLEWLCRVVETLKERAKTLKEMAQMAAFYFQAPQEYDPKGERKFLKSQILPYLEALVSELDKLNDFSERSVEEAFNRVMERFDVKLKHLAQPCRVALTGKTVSPGIFEIISVMGKEEAISRLKRAIEHIKSKSDT